MIEHSQPSEAAGTNNRVRTGLVMAGLASGVVLTLGWWVAIVVGLYHAVG